MRNIPDDNLAYPVYLKLDSGFSGSGFFMRTDERVYLITAKHVLCNQKTQELLGSELSLVAQTRDINDESTHKFSIKLDKVNILTHGHDDVCAVEMGNIEKNDESGSMRVVYCDGVELLEEGSDDAIVVANAATSTKLLNEVLISNDVYLYGYPTSLGMASSPQFDYNAPLLRKGIVANIYPSRGTIILDCPVYYGNSGGPVVEIEQEGSDINHKIIGVVSQFIPFVEEWVNTKNNLVNTELSNSGYSVAVAMDKVFELINYTKA